MAENDRDSFLSLFKHKSAMDPRAAGAISIDSSDEEAIESYQLGSSTKRKRGAKSVNRSKSDVSSTVAKPKLKKRMTEPNLIDLDDQDSALNNTTPSPALPSFLATALQKVHENKELRKQLKASSANMASASTTAAPSISKAHKPASAPFVHTIDDHDDDDCTPDAPNNFTTNKSTNTNAGETIVFSVFAHTEDKPAKFRCLKAESFTKMLDAYCKLRKVHSATAGLKWYGLLLNLHQNPLFYGMTDEESLYYYDSSNSSNLIADQAPPTVGSDVGSANARNTDQDHTRVIPKPSKVPADVITLKLQHGGAHPQKYRIRTTDPFNKLIIGYRTKHELGVHDKVTLLFDGLPLQENDTPETHAMEDEDIIDVKIIIK